MDALIKQSIRELNSYVVDNGPAKIRLDANESPYNLFDEFKEEFLKRIEKADLNRYPDTESGELCLALARAKGVQAENIICGNGSDEIIQIIVNTFVDKDDWVIITPPTFSMYGIFSAIAGGKVVEVPTDEQFAINTGEIIRQANEQAVKVIFLCSPNNPTGTIIPREEIIKIIRETSALVVLDEAYNEFCDESHLDLALDNPRVIVLHTLSKAFALAGARVGFGIGGKDTIDVLKRVKPPYNLNTFSQIAGSIFMENQTAVKLAVTRIIEERERVIEELQSIKGIKVYPSAANFVLIKTEKAGAFHQICQKRGIGVRSFDGKPLENCIRISIGSSNENTEILNVLKGWL